jgi:hypothetical protein
VNSIKVGDKLKCIPIDYKTPTDFWVQVCCMDSKIKKYSEMFADLVKKYAEGKNESYR